MWVCIIASLRHPSSYLLWLFILRRSQKDKQQSTPTDNVQLCRGKIFGHKLGTVTLYWPFVSFGSLVVLKKKICVTFNLINMSQLQPRVPLCLLVWAVTIAARLKDKSHTCLHITLQSIRGNSGWPVLQPQYGLSLSKPERITVDSTPTLGLTLMETQCELWHSESSAALLYLWPK